MPDESAPTEGTAEQQPIETWDDAYDAAEKEIGIGEEQQEASPQAQEETAESAETVEEEPVAEEPEHVKWAKSIDGDYDKETGELISDRVAKRAYELNKQYQPTAQRKAELEKILLHPDIYPHVQKVMSGEKPASEEPKEPEREKTEEEILGEYVDSRAKKILEPVQQQNEMLFENLYNTQVATTLHTLRESFGKDGEDYIYDQVAPQVGQQIAYQANLMRTDPQTFLKSIVRHGIQTNNPNLLFETFASATRNLLYSQMAEKQTKDREASERKVVAQKKKAALPKKGTSAKDVKASKEIETFDDALAEAERELKEQGIPIPE